MKDVRKEENNKDEKKSKKLIFIIVGIILLLIILFLIWWFNRKFDVTFKYNNSEPDYTVKVKYLNVIKDKDVKKDLIYNEHSFIGYFETYKLDTSKSKNCKEGFELNKEKDKCIAKIEFDFKNTKIKNDTTIEALWSSISFVIDPTSRTINEGETFTINATVSGTNDKTVKWNSENNNIAKVDSNGKVTGVKKGNTNIIAESNGIKRTCKVTVNEVKKVEPKVEKKVENPKDTGKISLTSSKTCVVGNNSVKMTASITGNALDKTIKWTYPRCFSVQNTSSTVKTLTRNNSCSLNEELTPTVTAALNNGSKASKKFAYEPELKVTVYNNSKAITPADSGVYYGNNIKIETNINATFSGSYIASQTSKSATLRDTSQTKITIKTSCGQTKTVQVFAIIN